MSEPSLTHARVLRIALPVVLSNATIPILGAVGTAVIGQSGQAAPIGAVAMGAVFKVAPASPAVEGFAHTDLNLRIGGAPATIALYAITGWLIAVERTRSVLVVQVLMNGLNVGLDLWFVKTLGRRYPALRAGVQVQSARPVPTA